MEKDNPNYERPPATIGGARTDTEEAQHRKHDRQYKNAQTATNVLIALFTAVTAGVGYWQAHLTQEALKDTQRSSAIATNQTWHAIDNMNWMARTMDGSLKESQGALNATIEASRTDQRPWLGVLDISTPAQLAEGVELRPVVQVVNTGKSPAVNVVVSVFYRIIPQTEQFNPAAEMPQHRKEIQGVIVPNGRREFTVEGLGQIGKVRAEELNTGRYRFYIAGKIVYKDIFKRQHRTIFCIRLALGEHKAFEPYGSYNDAN